MNRKKSAMIPLFVLAIAAACRSDLSAPVVSVPPDILVAPTQIMIGATTLRITPYLWRDFQPPVAGEPPLLAQLRIHADGGNAIPSGVVVEKAWVVLDDKAWVATPRQEGPPPDASTLDVMARGGPPWPIGSSVIVVAQVRDADNVSHLLRAAPQTIMRAE